MREIADSKRIEQFMPDRVEPELYRFPAIDPATFRKAVEELLSE